MVLPLTVYDFEVACRHPPIPMIRRQITQPQRSVPLVLSRGFTLIELSIVVVIITMLLSLGLGVLNAQLSSAAQAETKKRQALIKDALTAYLGANKPLPCPDDPDITNGISGGPKKVDGVGEDRDGTGACKGNISGGVVFGVVPYTTLGLSREVALDGWGNFMSYSIPAFDATNCRDTVIPYWSREDCFGTAPPPNLYSLFGGTGTDPISVATNVLAVVISHGPNGFAAWGRQGSQNIAPTRCEEAHNAKINNLCNNKTAKDFFGGEYSSEVDDVVIALTREEATSKLIMQGTLRSAEGKLVEDLARLRSDKLYEKVTGDCSRVDDPTTEHDPWGELYGVVQGIEADNYLPICICTKRGSGTMPPEPADSTCSTIAPTTCIQINAPEVNLLRIQMGKDEC